MVELVFILLLLAGAWVVYSRRRVPTRAKSGAAGAQKLADPGRAAVLQSARRLADIVTESIQIARTSKDPETKLSRLGVAKSSLAELDALTSRYSYLEISSLDAVRLSIDELEAEFDRSKYREAADGNARGQELEKSGDVLGAIAEYEKLLEAGVDTPSTYRRLAILYSKLKKPEEERRVLAAAIRNVPSTNSAHYRWFAERLAKKA